MKEIIEQITAGSPMVGTLIILVWRPISLGLIKDLRDHPITVRLWQAVCKSTSELGTPLHIGQPAGSQWRPL